MSKFSVDKCSTEELERIDEDLKAITAVCAVCDSEGTTEECDGCILSRVTDEAWEAHKALEDRVGSWMDDDDVDAEDVADYYGEEENGEGMDRKEILEAAKRCVCGDREQDYGKPERNFELIGEMWTTYLKAKCVSPEADVCINGEDVATLMCLFKIARIATGRGKADSFIDLAGYAACAGELATGGGAE